MMVYPIKGCGEINLHDPSLKPTLKCTLKSITGIPGYHGYHRYQDLSDKQTVGWKRTTTFHKIVRDEPMLDVKTPYRVRQYGCYGNRSLIDNREGR